MATPHDSNAETGGTPVVGSTSIAAPGASYAVASERVKEKSAGASAACGGRPRLG
jgi:hypothetical protein